MDIKEAIYGRRSIRKYLDKEISESDILEILEAGTMAPSAVNYQPWYFVAIKSKAEMEEIQKIMELTSKELAPDLKEMFKDHPQVFKETDYFIRLLGGAPLCILAFRHKPDYSKTDNSITQSIAAAIQNMLLMAYSKGIGSCWLTAPLEVGTDKLLKERYAKDKGEMVAIMTFGYPDQIANMPRRKEGRYTII